MTGASKLQTETAYSGGFCSPLIMDSAVAVAVDVPGWPPPTLGRIGTRRNQTFTVFVHHDEVAQSVA